MTPVELGAAAQAGDVLVLDARGGRRALEMPTVMLLALTYGGWITVTLQYQRWPLWVVLPLAALFVALHSSLQHEIVHGHPTRWEVVNRVLGMLPLSLWLPFERYRVLHRRHHIDARLTDPLDDPETFYWQPEDWARMRPLTRLLLRAQQTLAGRVLIGSWWHIGAFWRADWRRARSGDATVSGHYLEHLLWCVPVLMWVKFVCEMPLLLYVLAVVVPASGVQLIRSFAEHRARPQAPERIAIVEDSWLLGPLFLFNNLHAVHHEAPLIPWYELPARYRLIRERITAANGGLVYRTYFEVARRYLFRAHDLPTHPDGRAP
ncbi:MAG: fatty acid desaturase [Gammaproteobacteria bacterium]|nr:fatty acid desaturase [Gammaproteobacteria bacterium]MBV9697582.1 fatty acid desaturase [Gammaproteobacteria bacterium]